MTRPVTEFNEAAEHDKNRLPARDLSLIIGIVHPSKMDAIELVDKSHCLAAMIWSNVSVVDGYLGFFGTRL